MGEPRWTRRPRPVYADTITAWRGQPGSVAGLTRLRHRLRAALTDGRLPAGSDDGERLLLAAEELASNGVRHGRPPVVLSVTATGRGWLLEVSDAAPDRPPVPPVDRDAADGGMGLALVARTSRGHGWTVDGDRKTVWADIPYRSAEHRLTVDRIRAATIRACDLTACLGATEARAAATLQRLAEDAAAAGRYELASRRRAAAQDARRQAERARRISRTPRPEAAPGPLLPAGGS
jgi:anti-sigma regulatory factor (Ser/Thr protein kinase)